MTKAQRQKLKKQYESACNQYAQMFCKKQGLSFDGWVGGTVGETAYCGDYFFNLSDMAYDINAKIKKGVALEWHDYCIEVHPDYINYFAYSNGVRLKNKKKHGTGKRRT